MKIALAAATGYTLHNAIPMEFSISNGKASCFGRELVENERYMFLSPPQGFGCHLQIETSETPVTLNVFVQEEMAVA